MPRADTTARTTATTIRTTSMLRSVTSSNGSVPFSDSVRRPDDRRNIIATADTTTAAVITMAATTTAVTTTTAMSRCFDRPYARVIRPASKRVDELVNTETAADIR